MKIKFFGRLGSCVLCGLLVFSLNSCLDDDNEFESFGLGDVFIESKMENDELVHRPVYFAFSDYYGITSASVVTESNDIVEMYGYMNYSTTFANDEAEFSSELPLAGSYEFDIEFSNGGSVQVTDSLEENYILPPVITEINEDIAGEMEITWDELDDEELDAYSIRIFADGEKVYTSPLLKSDVTEFTVKATDRYWLESIDETTEVRVKLSAYRFEDGASSWAGRYNYQAVGVTYMNAEWNVE